MSQINEIISNLIEENLSERTIRLEKRFTREASDISSLEIEIDHLKSKY